MAVDPMLTQQNPLERYKVLHELGRGAIATVYAARDRSTGAVIALKTLDAAIVSEADAGLTRAFVENARSAARLKHRNIVKVLEAGEAGGTAYVTMELVVGESVRQALDKRPLSIARAIQILDDIASALAYAHEEGVVHRGVKPSNILVLRSGVAKIGDFGIGQIGEAALRYKSPEQVRGDAVDHRSDLFSLGTVLYEMLTRRALFQGSSPKEIMENILRAEPPPPSEVNPHVPAALDRILSGMLARNPEERVADARIILRDLQSLKEAFGLAPGARAEPILRTPEKTESAPRAQAKAAAPRPVTEPEPKLEPEASEIGEPSFMMDRGPVPERSSGSRVGRYAAGALMFAALVAVAVFLFYSPAPSEPRAGASPMQEAPAVPAPPPAPVAEATKEPAALPPAPQPKAEPTSLEIASAPAPSPPAPSVPEPLQVEPSPPAKTENVLVRKSEQTGARQPTATISKSLPDGTAKLILAVSPQGEVYVDGKHFGTTPPITTLDLPPGMHRIEIISGSRKPFLTYMTLQAGERRRIRHDFGARRSAPPT